MSPHKQWFQYGSSSVAQLKGVKEPCENFSSTKWLRKRVKVFVQCRQGILALGRLHHLTGESEHNRRTCQRTGPQIVYTGDRRKSVGGS